MATVYWYGGSGNWSDYTNHWSNNSGNSPASNHGSAPGTDDSVVFDSNSASDNYTVTGDVTADCLDFTMDKPTGASKKVTWKLDNPINVYGSFTLTGGTAGITQASYNTINFLSTSTGKTINTNGVALNHDIVFNGAGGGWSLSNDLETISNKGITLTKGSFSMVNGGSNYNVKIGYFSSNNSNTRTFTMGSGTLEIIYYGQIFNFDITNLTLNAGTSTVKFTYNGTQAITTTTRGATFYNMWVATVGTSIFNIGTASASVAAITLNDLKINAGREVNIYTGSTTTVNTLTALGTSGSHIVIHSTTSTHATLAKAGGGVITGCDYIDIQDMTGSPDLTWYIGPNSTDTDSTCTNIYLSNAVTTNIKTYNTNLAANIKTINTNAIANVKTLNTNTNV